MALLQEVMNMYLLDDLADEMTSESQNLTLIADRVTRRIYRGNGDNYAPTLDDFAATDWILVKYEVDGNAVITGG